MITSVPIGIIQLGLGFEDYSKIAKNINRILNIPESKWQKILNRANSELSPKTREIGLRLNSDMAYDREFFTEADLPYHEGPPIPGCFITSLADYLLRNKEKLKR